jgi:hypothetical protein
VCSSALLVQFLLDKGGVVRGDKIKNNIDIPFWIKGNSKYEKAVIRGLTYAGGCFYTHKHLISGRYYYNLGYCFTSFSKNLINSVSEILQMNGISPHLANKGRSIYIYSGRDQQRYLEVFGPSYPRILNKYLAWRGVRVVEGADLESLYTRKGIKGSNPFLSAMNLPFLYVT